MVEGLAQLYLELLSRVERGIQVLSTQPSPWLQIEPQNLPGKGNEFAYLSWGDLRLPC